ncbi:hypothetical protein ACQ4PT_004843 [Festuca glaucescens]
MREDKPKYEKGAKPRLKKNPINERYKKNKRREGKAFVGAEYTSDEESEEKVVGVVGLALAEPGSLFTYDYTKDYSENSSIPKNSGTCLMARGAKEDYSDNSSNPKNSDISVMARGAKVISPPSLSSILDEDNDMDNDEDDDIITSLFIVRYSLRGDPLAKFEFLMDTVASRDESIEDLKSHIENEKQRFNLLKQGLSDEKNTSFLLKKQFETFELDKVKDMDTLHRALLMSQKLDPSKKELEVAHASFTKDLEHLELANRLVKGELMKLREDQDQLRATYEKTLGKLNDPIVVENIACASNSTIDQALLIEKNNKLKEQLEKEHLTTPSKGKTLDEVLAHQKVRAHKQGIGYNPRNYKNEAIPPKKVNFVQEGHKVDGSVKKAVVNGDPQEATPITNAGYDSYFCKHYVKVFRSDNLKLVLVGYVEDNLYVVDLSKEGASHPTCIMAKVDETPYELITGNKPNIMYFRVFECKCLVKNKKERLGKFETRTIEGIFVGYEDDSHTYRYYNISNGCVEVSCDVEFMENNGSQAEQVVSSHVGDGVSSQVIKAMGIGHIIPMLTHEVVDQTNDGEYPSSTQVEPSSTKVEPSSASQGEQITQEELHAEEQAPSPQPLEQDQEREQESSTPRDQTQVVVHGQDLSRGEFVDHEGTIRRIKAASKASGIHVDKILERISKGV